MSSAHFSVSYIYSFACATCSRAWSARSPSVRLFLVPLLPSGVRHVPPLPTVRTRQLSYADTHPMFTRKSYPNFFRIVPSENAFNAPRVKLLQAFNWTRVGTLYQNEPRFALVSAFLSFVLKKVTL